MAELTQRPCPSCGALMEIREGVWDGVVEGAPVSEPITYHRCHACNEKVAKGRDIVAARHKDIQGAVDAIMMLRLCGYNLAAMFAAKGVLADYVKGVLRQAKVDKVTLQPDLIARLEDAFAQSAHIYDPSAINRVLGLIEELRRLC